MEFLDFELRISEGADGAYSVTVVRSPTGEATATMRLSIDDPKLQGRLQAVGNARGAGGQTRKGSDPQRALVLPNETDAKPRDTVKDFGRELFEALLPSEVRSCYRSSRNTAREQGKGLRLRLRMDAPELATLPWEYLYDESEGDYICLAAETPLIRYLELARPPQPLTIQPPLRILGMVASPSDLPELDVELEKRQMAEAIQHLQDEGQVSLTWLEGQTWRDLQKAMRGGPWHVFHFIGHGDFDASDQEGLIALADEQGQASLLSATQLGRLLASHASMRLVVLNSCEGARASETDLFSSTGSVLTRRGIPAVVSMQYAITDRAALEFSRMFYDTLAEGLPVDAAVTEARIAISMTMNDSFEWHSPVLHMRASDGHLFAINAAGAIFPETTEAPPQKPQPAPPVEAAPLPVPSAPPAADETQRGLQILLRKVKQFWIEGVLENSLSHSGLIDLGMDTLPEMVDSPWGSTPLDPTQPIVGVCDELGGSFLILGVPGAGKTTIMLTLVRELIAQAEQDPSRPIPIVSNLTSWTDTSQSLFDWLIDELSTKYQIPKKIGRAWMQQGRLRIFLDGLDEVNAERRSACVRTINAFITEASLMSVAVCCRFNEYIRLALIPGGICELFMATLGALRPGVTEMKAVPNIGIILSVRSAAVAGLSSGLILTALMLVFVSTKVQSLRDHSWHHGYLPSVVELAICSTIGLVFGLIIGLRFGILDVLQHYLLRLMLFFGGHTPLNYVRFLDHAAKDLNFLQKVGGGYIFIHRMLLEHFAAMENEGKSNPQDTPTLAAPRPFESVSDG